MSKLRFETLQVHAGQEVDPATHARAVPIYQTSSYVLQMLRMEPIFCPAQIRQYIYPPDESDQWCIRKRIAALEGGAAALATSSGQSAQFLALNNILSAGDNFISTSHLYGGTYNQFKNQFKRLGIETRFTPNDTPDEFENWLMIKPKPFT